MLILPDVFGRALCHHRAAVLARARPHVHHMVGGLDGFFVMFHHDHAVAHVAQSLQRIQQPVVIALVQADGWLVQHIHHAGQAGADLAGQADAL